MKKMYVILAIGIFTLYSCKKDWTCECTLNGTVVDSKTITDKSKKEAESECNGETTFFGMTVSCGLK